MAEQQVTNNSGRSLIIFLGIGILLVGLFFGGAQLLKVRNNEVAGNTNGQSQQAQSGQPTETRPGEKDQNENQPSAEEQQARQEREREAAANAEREKQERERQAAENRARQQREQQATEERELAATEARREREQQASASQRQEAAQPRSVASTGPSDGLPATGPITDYAVGAVGLTLMGFGIHRWRQSKLALLPKS
jgi:hypothetical protein